MASAHLSNVKHCVFLQLFRTAPSSILIETINALRLPNNSHVGDIDSTKF